MLQLKNLKIVTGPEPRKIVPHAPGPLKFTAGREPSHSVRETLRPPPGDVGYGLTNIGEVLSLPPFDYEHRRCVTEHEHED